jgi:hypothetical protein
MAGFTGDDVARALRVLGARRSLPVRVDRPGVPGARGLPAAGARGRLRRAGDGGAADPGRREDWAYGVGKRAAEDALAAAAVPSTRVRIPMVNGERDPKRRLESYLWRMLDGGPLLVPGADAIARHVYRGAVVEALAAHGRAPAAGRRPTTSPSASSRRCASCSSGWARWSAFGRGSSTCRPRHRGGRAGVRDLGVAAVDDVDVPRRSRAAVAELGFAHPPLDAYLGGDRRRAGDRLARRTAGGLRAAGARGRAGGLSYAFIAAVSRASARAAPGLSSNDSATKQLTRRSRALRWVA